MVNYLIEKFKDSPELFVSLAAFILVWITFRVSFGIIKKSILATIREELDLLGRWLGNAYDDNSNNKWWYDPLHMVVGLNRATSIQNYLSNVYISLLSRDLLVALTGLNQGLARFNQHLERQISFVTNNKLTIDAYNAVINDLKNISLSQNDIYCKIQNGKQSEAPYPKDVAYFLEYIYKLNKLLHTDGIGGKGYYDDAQNGKRFPTPHQSYLLAEKALKKEEAKEYLSLKNWLWLFADGFVIAIILFTLSLLTDK